MALGVTLTADKTPVLKAYVSGTREPLTDRNLLRSFRGVPFLTFKVIGAIHLQAVKLWWKGLRLKRRTASRRTTPSIFLPEARHPAMTSEPLHAREGLIGRLIVAIGRRLLPRELRGGLRLTLPSGQTFGSVFAIPAPMRPHLEQLPRRSGQRSGAAPSASAESYMTGGWDSSDITAVLRFYLQNRDALNRRRSPCSSRASATALFHLMRDNDRDRRTPQHQRPLRPRQRLLRALARPRR